MESDEELAIRSLFLHKGVDLLFSRLPPEKTETIVPFQQIEQAFDLSLRKIADPQKLGSEVVFEGRAVGVPVRVSLCAHADQRHGLGLRRSQERQQLLDLQCDLIHEQVD